MDKDFEPALPAAQLRRAGEHNEEIPPQEAMRLSVIENDANTSMSSETQLGERSARMKRKAEDDLRTDAKRTPSAAVNVASDGSSGSNAFSNLQPSLASAAPSEVTIAYPNGAIRITRTPGRRETKNCVNLQDMIHKDHLLAACIFSFFIGDKELYDHLPLSHSSDAVPIYIGRDANLDPMLQEACNQAGVAFRERMQNKQLQSIKSNLRLIYKERYGTNYHAFYAWSPGFSHSKIMVLIYPDFLRLVITSCNMIDIDTVFGDNHWYIHDLPKLSSRSRSAPSSFEVDLLSHLQALSTPDVFLDSIRGMYDYSKVQVHLVTSIPGVQAGIKAENHGLLRLRRIVQDLDLKLPEKENGELRLEICAASIGNLNAKWLSGFYDCALGKDKIAVGSEDCVVPKMKLFYPTVGDVKRASKEAQDSASNIGCHARPWESAPDDVKKIFHHYESKDTGRLFHQKFILAYNPKDEKAAPYFVYIGSANFSQSAWGALENDSMKKANEQTCKTKLVKMSNLECGVVIPGHLIKGMLEPGTLTWQRGIVPYAQDAPRYNLPRDKPWNDPKWAQGYPEDRAGT